MNVVSLAAAACVVVAMERWTRMCGLRHNAILSAVLLCTTWLFARSAWDSPEAMLTVLFTTLSFSSFFIIYSRSKSSGAKIPAGDVAVLPPRAISEHGPPDAREDSYDHALVRPDTGHAESVGVATVSSCHAANRNLLLSRAWLPVWLFGALLCGGVAGLVAPLAGIAAFVTIRREWKLAGRWIGLREVLIFAVLCLLWVELRWDGGPVFNPAPREHLFWYPLRLLRDLLPWTPLYIIMIAIALWRGKLRSDCAKFIYTSIWANILAMSLMSSKSEVYLLPIYPLVAFLTAALLRRSRKARR